MSDLGGDVVIPGEFVSLEWFTARKPYLIGIFIKLDCDVRPIPLRKSPGHALGVIYGLVADVYTLVASIWVWWWW